MGLDRDHGPRRVLGRAVGLVLAQLEAAAAVGLHLQRAAEEAADGAVRDRLVVAVPAAVLAELDLAPADGGGTRPRPHPPPALSRAHRPGPPLTHPRAPRPPQPA